MEIAIRNFAVGHCVYAKIKGHPSWPGIVTEIKKNKAKVVYFNWHNQFNWVGFKKITPIGLAANIVQTNYKKNIHFKRAVDEMNIVIDSVIKERKVASNVQSGFQEKNPLNPVVRLKLLTKNEIVSIVDDLKEKNKNKNKLWKLRLRKRK